jgi:hypothetical protein
MGMAFKFRPIAPRHGIGSSIVITRCYPAGIFSDCLKLCAGTIDHATPGPVCGWTFDESFGVLGGSVTLAPGTMTFNTTATTDFPGVHKPIPSPLANILNLSAEFEFTEFATPPTVNTTYSMFINNVDNLSTFLLTMFGDGSLFYQFGNPASSPTYLGTWTPNGGSHKVFISITALGVPSLFIDGVNIPIPFFGNLATFGSFFPMNTAGFFIGSDSAVPASAVVRDLFVAPGVLPKDVVFCCPP